MARIKINDLPADVMISKEEMKKVFGGVSSEDLSNLSYFNYSSPINSSFSWGGMTEDPTGGSLQISSSGTRLIKLDGFQP